MANEKPKYATFRDLHLTNQGVKLETKRESDQQTQSARQSHSDQPTLSANRATQSVPQAQSDQLALSAQLAPIPNIAGDTRVPNVILEWLLPQLRVQEQAVYLRLYRLSHGFRSDTCRVGFEKLAKGCNI